MPVPRTTGRFCLLACPSCPSAANSHLHHLTDVTASGLSSCSILGLVQTPEWSHPSQDLAAPSDSACSNFCCHDSGLPSNIVLLDSLKMMHAAAEQRRWFDMRTSKAKSKASEQHVSMSQSANSSLISQGTSRVSNDYSDDGMLDANQASETDR